MEVQLHKPEAENFRLEQELADIHDIFEDLEKSIPNTTVTENYREASKSRNLEDTEEGENILQLNGEIEAVSKDTAVAQEVEEGSSDEESEPRRSPSEGILTKLVQLEKVQDSSEPEKSQAWRMCKQLKQQLVDIQAVHQVCVERSREMETQRRTIDEAEQQLERQEHELHEVVLKTKIRKMANTIQTLLELKAQAMHDKVECERMVYKLEEKVLSATTELNSQRAGWESTTKMVEGKHKERVEHYESSSKELEEKLSMMEFKLVNKQEAWKKSMTATEDKYERRLKYFESNIRELEQKISATADESTTERDAWNYTMRETEYQHKNTVKSLNLKIRELGMYNDCWIRQREDYRNNITRLEKDLCNELNLKKTISEELAQAQTANNSKWIQQAEKPEKEWRKRMDESQADLEAKICELEKLKDEFGHRHIKLGRELDSTKTIMSDERVSHEKERAQLHQQIDRMVAQLQVNSDSKTRKINFDFMKASQFESSSADIKTLVNKLAIPMVEISLDIAKKLTRINTKSAKEENEASFSNLKLRGELRTELEDCRKEQDLVRDTAVALYMFVKESSKSSEKDRDTRKEYLESKLHNFGYKKQQRSLREIMNGNRLEKRRLDEELAEHRSQLEKAQMLGSQYQSLSAKGVQQKIEELYMMEHFGQLLKDKVEAT